MNELEKFKKKALNYKEALNKHPHARLLELYPILWHLERHRNALGKKKGSIKIVDFMAGSGFLSENLYKIGYTDLHAVELCEEMYKNSDVYSSKVRLHMMTNFEKLESILTDIKPDIIITLASFHHLLIYDKNNNLDTVSSVEMQKDIVDICMRTLPEHGILIIADLIESDVLETTTDFLKKPMKPIAKDLVTLGLDKNFGQLLGKNDSLNGASGLIQREMGVKTGNLSLNWFRTVIDRVTAIGHKDVAISVNFLKTVGEYNPIITKYYCPWLFKSKGDLVEFIYKKFAFGIVEKGMPIFSENEVTDAAEESLGIRNNHDLSALGWNLGIVCLGKKDPVADEQWLNLIITSLAIIVVILLIAIALRYWFDIYALIDFKDLLVFGATLPLGIIIGTWIQKKKK